MGYDQYFEPRGGAKPRKPVVDGLPESNRSRGVAYASQPQLSAVAKPTSRATPDMNVARNPVPSAVVPSVKASMPTTGMATASPVQPAAPQGVGVNPSFSPPQPTLPSEAMGAMASLNASLPQSVVRQQAQNDARQMVMATQPQAGIDTTIGMEGRNQAFRDVGVGAASFDQGPSGFGPVRGVVANVPVPTGPVDPRFAGSGVGSPASATGARISGGPNAVMANPFVPQMSPEQAQQEMSYDQLKGKRVQVDPRYVRGIQEQNKAQDKRIANRIAGVGQEGIIGRMNANYMTDRLARDEARQVRGREDRFARAALSAAMTDPNPAVRAAALEQAGQSSDRFAKAAPPVGGFAGARDQLAKEAEMKANREAAERVAVAGAEAKGAAGQAKLDLERDKLKLREKEVTTRIAEMQKQDEYKKRDAATQRRIEVLVAKLPAASDDEKKMILDELDQLSIPKLDNPSGGTNNTKVTYNGKQVDYSEVPSGETYVTPDGQTRKKK